MPPIPIHSNSPINSATAAEKPEAASPQTDSPAVYNDPNANVTPSTTTAPPVGDARFPPPKPGQSAVPAPTAAINQPYAHQQPPPPTKTSSNVLPPPETDSAPPAPQPGAVPIPPPPTSASSSVSQAQQQQQAPPPTLPPQLSMPPPQPNQAPTHSTYVPPSPFTQPPPQQLVASGAADLSHPPGYTQDTRHFELTAAQRAAQEQQEREAGVLAGAAERVRGMAGAPATNSSEAGAGGGMFGAGAAGSGGAAVNLQEQVPQAAAAGWDAAKSWMSGVAGKVTEMEGEVWRRVNGEK